MFKVSKKQTEAIRKEASSKAFRKILIEEVGTTCANCGSDEAVEYHHIVPVVYGGTNRITNIVPLCYNCHARAHQKASGEGLKLARAEGRLGRKHIADYVDAIPTLKRYFDMEIGNKELTLLLGYANGRSTLNDYKHMYRKEFNVPKDFYNNIDIKAVQEQRVLSQKQNKLRRIAE